MKRYKKIYAIRTLAEKHTTFHLGKTKVHVSFTGGQVTKNGVNPATFTTDDPIVQLAIERSNDFAKGAISLMAKYPLQGEVKIGMNPQQAKETAVPNPDLSKTDLSKTELIIEAAALVPPPIQEETAEPDQGAKDEEPEKTTKASEEEMPGETDGEQEESMKGNLEVVEVSCSDVAKQYLQEHFGEKPTPLRRIADIQECAAKYGITFSFV